MAEQVKRYTVRKVVFETGLKDPKGEPIIRTYMTESNSGNDNIKTATLRGRKVALLVTVIGVEMHASGIVKVSIWVTPPNVSDMRLWREYYVRGTIEVENDPILDDEDIIFAEEAPND